VVLTSYRSQYLKSPGLEFANAFSVIKVAALMAKARMHSHLLVVTALRCRLDL
jgi:hypothetical protein